MATRETWKRRVADWRASGLSAEDFALGRGFNAEAGTIEALKTWMGEKGVLVSDRSVSIPRERLRGIEPSFNIVKVYALWLENDGINVADIVLSLKDNNCASPYNVLRYDLSRDVKKMVYADSSASNKALCAQLNAYNIPAGTTRQVMVVVYYSADTVMR